MAGGGRDLCRSTAVCSFWAVRETPCEERRIWRVANAPANVKGRGMVIGESEKIFAAVILPCRSFFRQLLLFLTASVEFSAFARIPSGVYLWFVHSYAVKAVVESMC